MIKNHHMNHNWTNRHNVRTACCDDPEYIKVFNEYFKDFKGSILELGAGTGGLAYDILEAYEDIEYTVLDLEKNMPLVKDRLKSFSNVKFIASHEYEKIFDQSWDLFIGNYSINETPEHYYDSIFNNIRANSFFSIAGNYEQALTSHFTSSLDKFLENYNDCKVYKDVGKPGLPYPNISFGNARLPSSLFVCKNRIL